MIRVSVVSATLGGHTHLHVSVNGARLADEQLTLKNEHVAEFLDRLQPEELTDATPKGHEPVAGRWMDSGRQKVWLK